MLTVQSYGCLSAFRSSPGSPECAIAAGGTGPKVVRRGGSCYDRPKRARSSFRMNYEPWQPVYNVRFRVAMEVE